MGTLLNVPMYKPGLHENHQRKVYAAARLGQTLELPFADGDQVCH